MTSEIATRTTPGTIAELCEQISLSSWGNSLVNGTAYEEPDPGHLNRILLMQVLTAESPEDVMGDSGVHKLQQLVPDVPGQTTGPLEITDLYITGSDFGEGVPCYMIVSYVNMNDGEPGKFTTGAAYLQAQFLAMLNLGNWPIQCQVKRIGRRDKGGKYLFQMYPPD